MISRRIVLLMFGTAIAGVPMAIRCARSYAQQAATHDVPAAQSGGTVVMLCDGKTSIEVKDFKPGEKMSRARAQAVSDKLMDQWHRAHPDEQWEVAQAAPASPKSSTATTSGTQAPAAAPSLAVQQGDTYASFQPRDY